MSSGTFCCEPRRSAVKASGQSVAGPRELARAGFQTARRHRPGLSQMQRRLHQSRVPSTVQHVRKLQAHSAGRSVMQSRFLDVWTGSRVPLPCPAACRDAASHGTKDAEAGEHVDWGERNPRPELGETLEAMVLSEPGKSTKGCGSGMWAQCASGPVQYRFNLQLSQMRGLRSDVQSLLGVLAKLFRPVQMPMKPHHMHPGKSAML